MKNNFLEEQSLGFLNIHQGRARAAFYNKQKYYMDIVLTICQVSK